MDLLTKLEEHLSKIAIELGATKVTSVLERPRDASHGDYASSLALALAKQLGRPPIEIANEIATKALENPLIEKAEVAKPGFVNLTVTADARSEVVTRVLLAKQDFGRHANIDKKMLLEFVSSNPTGPLHVGHGRAAALGDSLAKIMRFCGWDVYCEYYVNDLGLQVEVLAASLWQRILMQLDAAQKPMPTGSYQGDYLSKTATQYIEECKKQNQASYLKATVINLDDLPADDKQKSAALLAKRTAEVLGEEHFLNLRKFATSKMLELIQQELKDTQVIMDRWVSEREIHEKGEVQKALEAIAKADASYEKDGAMWFKSSEYGDEKDRVLVRSNGEFTYFATDIAYHVEKADKNNDCNFAFLGSDHHGYSPRIIAALKALGKNEKSFEFSFIQFVTLVNAGEQIKMSTREGNFHSLRDLVANIGSDAVRLYFVLTKTNAPLEFDVAKAATKSSENPVFYLQYAHARSCSLIEKSGQDINSLDKINPKELESKEALAVLAELNWFEPILRQAAKEREPHKVAHWLIALAAALHKYYDRVPVLTADDAAKNTRLALVCATRQTLCNGLALLGVNAPTKM